MPDRAAVAMREAAERRASRSKEGKSDAERITKPSRSSAERAAVYGLEAEVVMLDMVSEEMLLGASIKRRGTWSYATFMAFFLGLRVRFARIRNIGRLLVGFICRWVREGEGDGSFGTAFVAAFVGLVHSVGHVAIYSREL